MGQTYDGTFSWNSKNVSQHNSIDQTFVGLPINLCRVCMDLVSYEI